MDAMLALVGLAKLVFGVLVGVAGITVAARVAKRLAGFSSLDEQLREGNVAVGVILSASILATAILVAPAVSGTFGALDLLLRSEPGAGVVWVLAYAAAHVAAALGVAVGLLVVGAQMERFERESLEHQ